MVRIMEDKYGKAKRIWVMDRGMVSESNLEYMRKTGTRYLVGTPKTMWRTLQQWMKASGIGTAPRKLLEELQELKSLEVLLPTRDKIISSSIPRHAPGLRFRLFKVLIPLIIDEFLHAVQLLFTHLVKTILPFDIID